MAAEPDEQVGAPFERIQHVEIRNAAAGAVRHVAVDGQHDGGLVVGVDQFRCGDADDAAMPPVAADDQDVVRADGGIGLDRLLRGRHELRLFLLAPQILVVQLLGERAGLLLERAVGGEEQPRRDVGRAHAAGGVDAGRQHERDLIAVDGLAGQPAAIEQRPQADGVWSPAERLEAEPCDHAVLADQRHDVGQRADRGDLDERRQPLAAPGASAERLHQFEGDADPGQVFVRVRAVVALGIQHGHRHRQLIVRLVVVGDDQVDAELAGAARRLDAADAAVDGNDQRDAVSRAAARWQPAGGRSRRAIARE